MLLLAEKILNSTATLSNLQYVSKGLKILLLHVHAPKFMRMRRWCGVNILLRYKIYTMFL